MRRITVISVVALGVLLASCSSENKESQGNDYADVVDTSMMNVDTTSAEETRHKDSLYRDSTARASNSSQGSTTPQ